MTRIGVIPVTRTLVAQMARILGSSSAAYRAMDEICSRTSAGEGPLGFFMVPESHIILVGPLE